MASAPILLERYQDCTPKMRELLRVSATVELTRKNNYTPAQQQFISSVELQPVMQRVFAEWGFAKLRAHVGDDMLPAQILPLEEPSRC